MYILPSEPQKNQRDRRRRGLTLSPLGTTFLALFIIIILGALGWLTWRTRWQPYTNNVSGSPTTNPTEEVSAPSPTASLRPLPEEPTLAPTQTPLVIVITATPEARDIGELPNLMVMALSDAGYTHLFAYQPEGLGFTRLTTGEWDDAQPALSPDGSQVAFSSHRGGQWDIYTLNLTTGEVNQVTHDRGYDGAPSWSTDGLWIAFEKYVDNNLDIYIQPTDQSSSPLRVTVDNGADFAPSWKPTGNQIVFTTTRAGNNDIWMADIDKIGQEDFLTQLTSNPFNQSNAVWSPDGSQLAWVDDYEGYESIFVVDPLLTDTSARYIGSGSLAAWDPTGQHLLVKVRTPDKNFISIYDQEDRTLVMPPQAVTGRLEGLDWGANGLPAILPAPLQNIANEDRVSTWLLGLTPGPGSFFGRQSTIDMPGIKAPHAALSALAVEPFFALRDRTSGDTGWDVLSDLENAFIPLTAPLPPGRSNDWLYTGRAFALNQVLIDLGWMKVAREDFGAQTYWRVYLRPRNQDGSQGRPMPQFSWDFSARFTGNTSFYEAGGTSDTIIPEGYWVDFTALALEYGWERQPALSNWRAYYQGARFNVFSITNGLDWEQAMLQLYPPEIFMGDRAP